jgi:hypothetical protein
MFALHGENEAMPGITTALAVFILVGVALPALIKSKAQFYLAVAFIAAAILLSPFAFVVFISFIVAILQMLAFIALVLCAGGLELHEFAEHMVNAYDALRRGEEHPRPIIVPRSDQPKKEPVPSAENIPVPPPVSEPIQESIPMEPAPEQEGGSPSV